jgi:hypothetical protein
VAADLRGQLETLAGPGAAGEAVDDTLFVSMTDARVTAHTGAPLLFAPVVPATPPTDDGRAMATVRWAASHRTAGRFSEALEEYGRLAAFGDDAWLFGDPAALQGALARIRLLIELNRQEEAAVEAVALRKDLRGGRWRVDRTGFEAAWIKVNEACADNEL